MVLSPLARHRLLRFVNNGLHGVPQVRYTLNLNE